MSIVYVMQPRTNEQSLLSSKRLKITPSHGNIVMSNINNNNHNSNNGMENNDNHYDYDCDHNDYTAYDDDYDDGSAWLLWGAEVDR